MNKMILPGLLLTLLLTQEMNAQWTRTAGPEGGRAAALLTTPTSVLLGLEGGSLYRSTDHGTSWTAPVSGLGTYTGDVTGFAMIGAAVFTSTTGNGIFRSTDDGLSWAQASGDLPLLGRDIWALEAKGNTLLVATYAGVYRSTNSGGSWNHVVTGLPADTTFDAFQVTGSILLAGSDEGAGVFASTDDGVTWTRSSAGLSGDGLRVLCMAASAAGVLAGTREGAYWSADNGAHWTLCTSGLVNYTVSTLFANGTSFFAGTYGSGVFRSSNAGVDWAPAGNRPGNGNVRALTVIGADLLAGTYGPDVVYRSTNSGADWSGVGRGITCEGIESLVARSGRVLAATYTGMKSTTNLGSVWGPADSGMAGMTVYSLTLSPHDILAGTAGHGIYRSTDEGLSWTPANTGLGGSASTVWTIAVDSTNIFAGTSGGVYRSTNDGAQWVQATSGIPDSLIYRLTKLKGTAFAATRSSVYRSTDNGQHWTPAIAGLPQYFAPQEFAVADSMVFVALINGMFRSSDRGDSWVPVDSGLPSARDIRTVFAYGRPAPFRPAILVGMNNGGVFLSSNQGTSWVEADTGLTDGGMSVCAFAADAGYLYAGTIARSVWRRPLPEVLVSVDVGTIAPRGFALEQNYPNPFNPTTTLRYSIVERQWTIVKVFDILGREVQTLVNGLKGPGTYTAQFDGRGFASGLYICRLQTGSLVQSRKLLLLK